MITHNLASVDGRLTVAPGVLLLEGDDRWSGIAGTADPYRWIREQHDPEALLEGSGSFVTADAPPVVHDGEGSAAEAVADDHLPASIVDVPGRRWFVIVDGRGRVALEYTEQPDPETGLRWHALVLASRATAPEHLAWLRRRGVPYLVAGDGPVDLGRALGLLHGRLGVRTVVSTGGGRLNGALLRAGLVDEVDVEVLPAVIGGRGTPALFDAPPLGPDERPASLRLVGSSTTEDGRLRLRYAVVDGGRPEP